MLLHGISRHVIGVQIGAQLVVGVHVNLLLQLSAHILVSVVGAQVLVELGVLGVWLCLGGARLSLLFLSLHLLVLVVLECLLSLLVELDDQVMLLGSCQRHISKLII